MDSPTKEELDRVYCAMRRLQVSQWTLLIFQLSLGFWLLSNHGVVAAVVAGAVMWAEGLAHRNGLEFVGLANRARELRSKRDS